MSHQVSQVIEKQRELAQTHLIGGERHRKNVQTQLIKGSRARRSGDEGAPRVHNGNASCKTSCRCDAGHTGACVCRLSLTPGFRIGRRRVPSAFTACELEMQPLFVKPRLVSGLKADSFRDDVVRAVPHVEPLIMGFWQEDKATALGLTTV